MKTRERSPPNPTTLLEDHLRYSGLDLAEECVQTNLRFYNANDGSRWVSLLRSLRRHNRFSVDYSEIVEVSDELAPWVGDISISKPGYWRLKPGMLREDSSDYRCYVDLKHSLDPEIESPFPIAELAKPSRDKDQFSYKVRPEMKIRFPEAYETLRTYMAKPKARSDPTSFARGLANMYLWG